MEKIVIFAVLFILTVVLVYIVGSGITGMFIGFGQPTNAEWWNTSWHYRIRIDIDTDQYGRTNWPVEQQINFTDMLPSGTFDVNSTRIVEYSQSGSVLYEVPSQFDIGDNFDVSDNALGNLVFLLNGTTPSSTNRTFYVYYDTLENGAKEFKTYPTNLTFDQSGSIVTANSTNLRLFIDTNRGENTSGIHRAEDPYGNVIIAAGQGSRTAEYNEYSNGTSNTTFDLINNASFVNGSVRTIIEQIGNEIVFGQPSQQTNEMTVKKRYYIYNIVGPEQFGSFIKIEQTVTNSAGYQIQRNSTPAGSSTFDLGRTLNSGSIDTQDVENQNPYSWAWGSGVGGEMVGILNLEQNWTTNYFAANVPFDRIGIQLNSTDIGAGSSLRQVSLVYFSGTGGTDATTEFLDIKNRFEDPIVIYQSLPERWYVTATTSMNETIYNRNETVLIRGNVSQGDPYNLTEYMNATLDMGTPSPADDQTIILYDDGLHGDFGADDEIFANTFEIANDAAINEWTVNFTTYSNYSDFLNWTVHNFNVTDVLNVTVNIIDNKPQIGETVFADIYVKNYMQTKDITGAVINCSYDLTDVVNKTDNGDGTYSVNFTSPLTEGTYILYCNATKDGNFGNHSQSFDAEAAKTNVSIVAVPDNTTVSNITLYDNESFTIEANATNIQNGTAYQSNISLDVISGWYVDNISQECSDIEKNSFCNKNFSVTVPNGTVPGNYYLNLTVEWRNPDDTVDSNTTSINVTVEPNPSINVSESVLADEAGDGSPSYIGNFTVLSIGNSPLQNITFDCYSGTVCNDFVVNFTPNDIPNLDMNGNYSVAVNVTVPLGYPVGNYTGTVNVSAENDDYRNLTLNITVPSKTNVSIVIEPENYTASNLTQQDNETLQANMIIKNILKGSAKYANISLTLPSNVTSDSVLEFCNNLTENQTCLKIFNITVLNGTAPGSYYVNATTNWTNPDGTLGSNTTSLNITVVSNPSLNISENLLSQTVPDATNVYVGNFTVVSIGIGDLQNIGFDCYEGAVCNDFVVNFTPNDIPNLDMNGNYSVAVNVTVPLGYPVGNYTGTVNVSAENDDYRNLTLNITVPSNRTWTMDPTKCDKSETDEEGTVCLVTVMNLGNDVINFTVSPQELNHIKVNATIFYVNNWSNYTINVTYNITGFQQAVYNTIFDVDANQSNSNPDNMTLNATLYPYLPPIINFTITPNLTEQNSSVTVFANVTDASNSGIEWVNISVTKPDGSSNQTTMNLMSTAGNFSQWNFTYPDGLGNTSLRGAYNVTVTAVDNIGNIGNLSKNFTVHVKLVVSSTTLSTTYLQGDTGSIFYTAKDVNGTGIENVNVTFTIWDATGNISHYTLQQTSFDGIIFPLPTFSLASDAVTGNYTLFSNSTYYDSIANATVNTEKNSTFIVDPRTVTVTGLFADVETAVAWYPDNEMKFGILVYNGEGRPVDPDNMTITVYRPDDLVYGLFPFNMSSMTRMSTGYYTFAYQMDYGTPPGMYLAVLNVTQDDFTTSKITAFRVSQGGPYDVRINLFENEIPQGDYLDFELVVENKGSVTQDVYVEYNVTEMDLKNYFYDGETLYNYYYWAEAVLTPAFSNQSFTRQAHILSNQPLGTYLLSAKLTYDYVQPPIRPNATFSVVAAKVIPPAPPQPPTGQELVYVKEPEKAVGASIMIVGYNNNISLARGITKIENVVVRNSGSTNLNNVSLFVLGIPTDWFKITPERYATLVPDNSSVFLIEFNIPDNANIGEYKINFLALSGVVSDQKSSTVNIYSSIKELLEDEIKKIEEDLIDLKVDVRLAEREGKDVSDVMKFIDSIENYIKDAKNQIENNEFDRAIESVSSAINLLKKARDTLDNLEALQPEGFITIWIILILLIVIIAVVFLVVYLWRKKKLKPLLRPYVIQISRLMERAKRKEVDLEKLQKDKEKVLRMIKVLDNEKAEGIITDNSYKKVKKGLEKRLSEIEKKMK